MSVGLATQVPASLARFSKLVLYGLSPSKTYTLKIRATDEGKTNIWGIVIGY
jgi:hypothetical protein